VQFLVVVGDSSHFDPCKLPHALFERVEFLHVWHLNDHTVDVLIETSGDDFHLLLKSHVVVVELQLRVESRFEVFALLSVKTRILKQKIESLCVHYY
jgi:hypothetical protein